MTEFAIEPEVLARFERLGVALAIGLLMGVERGWKERAAPSGSRTAGVRTFALVGLLGGVLGMLGQELGAIVTALGFLAFAGVIGAFELRGARRERVNDATPAVAALVAAALGILAGVGFLRAAAAAGVAATLLLALKEGLHRWLERITFEELRAGLVLAAMTVILLPLLPDASIDPWGAVNPRTLWLMTILIAGVSFTGYAAIRIAGPGRGPLIAGLAGGLVSSTAVTVSFARMAKSRPKEAAGLVAGAVAAGAVMLVRVAVVASALRPELAAPLASAFAPAALAGGGAAAWLARRAGAPGKAGGAESLELRNPLDLPLALKFGAFLAVIALAAAWLEERFGAGGVYGLAAVSGLADVDAITLTMAGAGGPPRDVAALAVLIVVAVNTAAKLGLAFAAGGRAVAVRIGLPALLMTAVMAAGYAAWLGAA